MGLIMNQITIENENKKARLEKDIDDLYLSVTHNGYQWSSVKVDKETLGMIKVIISEYERRS